MSFGENNGVGIGSAGGHGTTMNSISIEALQEFKTTSGAFDAEYGNSTGAVINLSTKSGTNQFHGTAWEFFRNDVLDANNFFSNAAGLPRAPLRYNQYGANLGGPIWRNKIFFFFNYEGAKVRRLSQVTGNVPTPLMLSEEVNPVLRDDLSKLPSDCTATGNPFLCFHRRDDSSRDDEYTTLSRVDANLGKHRFGFRLAKNQQTVSNPTLQRDIRVFFPIPLKNWQLNDTWTISPTLVNEARFGYNFYPIARHRESTNPSDNVAIPGCCNATAVPRAITSPAGDWYNFDLTDVGSPTKVFVDNVSWIHGKHSFKGGFEVSNRTGDRLQLGQGAWEIYNSVDDIIHDRIYQLELDFGNPGKGYDLWTYAGFFQDSWKVSSRLQLNLGLRYEYYTPLNGSIGIQTRDPFSPLTPPGTPIWNSRRKDFGPRGGVVYDVLGDGKTVLRAGGAISFVAPQPFNYYDAAWLACSSGGTTSAIPAFPVVFPTDLPASLQPVSYPFPNSFLEQVRTNPCSAPPGLAGGRSVADPGGQDEYVEMWNMSVQRQMTPTLAVQVSYVGNRALHLYTTNHFNNVDPATGLRPEPSIGPITYRENAATSWYHALQVSVNKRLSKNFSFDAYYTWNKAMSYHGPETQGDNFFQDINDFAASRGPNQGTVGQRFTLVHTYQIPTASFAANSSFGRAILGGWNLQGIMAVRSGAALNITLGYDPVGSGLGYARPDRVPGVSQYASTDNRLVWLNPAAYDGNGPTVERRYGNLGFNTAVGPGAFNWDIGIHKSFAITERHRITFRVEMFNWLNHTSFESPTRAGYIQSTSTSLSDPNFGIITSSTNERNIQFALKYSF
jgi:hypothetical protein